MLDCSANMKSVGAVPKSSVGEEPSITVKLENLRDNLFLVRNQAAWLSHRILGEDPVVSPTPSDDPKNQPCVALLVSDLCAITSETWRCLEIVLSRV